MEQGGAAASAELEAVRAELAAVYASRSWRLTAPLRALRSRRRPPPAAPARAGPPRVLFVEHSVPTPDRDSGSADLVALLGLFATLGWQPTLFPAYDSDPADAYVDALRRAGVRVVTGANMPTLDAFLAGEADPFALCVVSRISMARGGTFAAFRRHSPHTRIVFNVVDLHFLRQAREALLLGSAAALDEAFRVQQMELAAVAAADGTIVLSEAEQQRLAALVPGARIHVVPMLRAASGRIRPFAGRHGIAFIGGFRHRPNVDAVTSFVHEVWPLLAGRLDGPFRIVGADPPPELRALAAPDIALLGHVPDLDAVLAGCRLTVAPLRFGAGIKGKVVSSLAAGVPCVASPIAAEGLGLVDGVNVRIAVGPQAFASAVLEVHEQAELWLRLSDAGIAHVRATFSEAAVRPRLAALLADIGVPVP